MEVWNRCTGDTRKKKSEKKLLLLNINATSNTQMKGEHDGIHSTLHTSYGTKNCVLNAMKMTVMSSDANLTTSLIKEGGVHVPTADITLPFWKESHTHNIQNYQEQHQTRNSSASISINQQTDDQIYIYFIELKRIFCHKLLKNKMHTCFCWKCATINKTVLLSVWHIKKP